MERTRPKDIFEEINPFCSKKCLKFSQNLKKTQTIQSIDNFKAIFVCLFFERLRGLVNRRQQTGHKVGVREAFVKNLFLKISGDFKNQNV